LIIKQKNGVIFNLGGGFSNKQRLNPPKIGDTITFKYYGLTKNNKPKFASFLKIRKSE
jgi:DNA ligase 1